VGVAAARPAVDNADKTIDAVREPLTRDLAELERTLQDARRVLARMDNLVQVNEGDVAEAVRNLRYASENVRALSDSLKQRPFSLVRTTQPPDRKVPR
jgi:ABC-type transporter Mla subunit MlaD